VSRDSETATLRGCGCGVIEMATRLESLARGVTTVIIAVKRPTFARLTVFFGLSSIHLCDYAEIGLKTGAMITQITAQPIKGIVFFDFCLAIRMQ